MDQQNTKLHDTEHGPQEGETRDVTILISHQQMVEVAEPALTKCEAIEVVLPASTCRPRPANRPILVSVKRSKSI